MDNLTCIKKKKEKKGKQKILTLKKKNSGNQGKEKIKTDISSNERQIYDNLKGKKKDFNMNFVRLHGRRT